MECIAFLFSLFVQAGHDCDCLSSVKPWQSHLWADSWVIGPQLCFNLNSNQSYILIWLTSGLCVGRNSWTSGSQQSQSSVLLNNQCVVRVTGSVWSVTRVHWVYELLLVLIGEFKAKKQSEEEKEWRGHVQFVFLVVTDIISLTYCYLIKYLAHIYWLYIGIPAYYNLLLFSELCSIVLPIIFHSDILGGQPLNEYTMMELIS